MPQSEAEVLDKHTAQRGRDTEHLQPYDNKNG